MGQITVKGCQITVKGRQITVKGRQMTGKKTNTGALVDNQTSGINKKLTSSFSILDERKHQNEESNIKNWIPCHDISPQKWLLQSNSNPFLILILSTFCSCTLISKRIWINDTMQF